MDEVNYFYPLARPTITEEAIDAATEVMRSGRTTMGEKVAEFEEEFGRYVKSPYAVMVNSGSSADLLAARALDIRGEVIIPAVTWPTHVWSWEHARADVKFCDVDGINTTAELIAAKITPKTRAVSIPHLMGVPVDMGPLLSLVAQRGLVLHEDCCEALGATCGFNRWGRQPVGFSADVASWSFFFSHQLSTMEGGMVTTTHRDIDRKVRSLRSHGWTRHFSTDKYTFHDEGYNLRPLEVSAAIGLVQLRGLAEANHQRGLNYKEFERILWKHDNIFLPTVPTESYPSWFGVPMFVKQGRDELAKYLESCGIETRPILAGNLKSQAAFRGFYFGKTPGADYVTDHGLYVGLHPTIKSGADEVARIIGSWG